MLTDNAPNDHQAFAGNYFSLSVGFGITMLLGIIYALLFKSNQKQGGRLQGFKCLIILFFMVLTTLSFLKPYIHLGSSGSIRIDKDSLYEEFNKLEPFTYNFGFSLGILAYSTVLS